jgi:hypothetical protein
LNSECIILYDYGVAKMADQISFLSNLPLEYAVSNLQSLHQSGNIGQWLFDFARTDVKISQNADGSVHFHLARRIRHNWGIAVIKGDLFQFHQGATQVEATCPLLTPYLWFSLASLLLFVPFFILWTFQLSSGLFFLMIIGLSLIFWSVRITMARNHLMNHFRQALA